jgi:hypothetical protein
MAKIFPHQEIHIQGDQIGRIFAYRAIVYFGQILKKVIDQARILHSVIPQ